MSSQERLIKFALQVALGVAVAAVIVAFLRGPSVPFTVPEVGVGRTSWLVLGAILAVIAVAAFSAEDKFSLYVASMFMLLSLGAVYAIANFFDIGPLGTVPWAIIILLSAVGAIRIYFQRQL